MNKDLDERLLPPGEYRDALNIQVAGSDSSNMGAAQNILGNQLAYASAINITGGKCVGSIADTENEKIYWFICGNSASAIAEYNQLSKEVSPVVVDPSNAVLKLDKSFLITGINVIDGLLFWTDNNTEPKVINIEKCKDGVDSSNPWTTLTKLKDYDETSYNITESDITVIKTGPTKPPTLTTSNTRRGGGTATLTTTVTGDFYDNSTNLPYVIGTTRTVTITGPDPTLENGDTVILTSGDNPDINGFDPDYTIRGSVSNFTAGGSTFTLTISSVPDSVTSDVNATWDLEIETGVDPMFKNKFVRFAYRYKYEDGQYSPVGPFTDVAFLPQDFDYAPKKGYNLGMDSELRYIKITNFVPSDVPKQVREIDVIYKDESNTNLYTVKSFKPKDPEWASNGSFELETELIYKTIESNQLLRPWDSVPKKAQAQELTANRLVYGNYLHNFDMIDSDGADVNPNFIFTIDPSTTFTPTVEGKSPHKSIKSMRTYQMGIVYSDSYGRETPVFTDNTGVQTVEKASAKNYSVINVKMNSTPPSWANRFKYFIKETSNEYYNLAMDRWYDAKDGNIWLSFPSAERNKISEDSFLILKKQHDNDTFVSDKAKYKVISISNEAPLFLKEHKSSMGKAYYTGITSGTFPAKDKIDFEITKDDFITNSGFNEDILSTSGLILRFVSSAGISDYYDIQSIALKTDGTDRYEITVKDEFGAEVDGAVGTFSSQAASLAVEISKVEIKNKPEFVGRFFTKIYRDSALESNIIASTIDESEYKISDTAEVNRRDNSCSQTNAGQWQTDAGRFRNFMFDRCDHSGHWNPSHSHGNPDLWYENVGLSKPQGVFKNQDIITISVLNTRDDWDSSFHANLADVAGKIRLNGTKFRWKNDSYNSNTGDAEVYTVIDSLVTKVTNYRGGNTSGHWTSNKRTIFTLKLNKPNTAIDQDDYPNRDFATINDEYQATNGAILELLEPDLGENTFTTDNPAIWETEPKEDLDVDIYYEASEAYAIDQHAVNKTLSWHNCYSFGNGVESNRVRDDFNAAQIKNGVKASAPLAEQYKEERKKSGLIFSGIYNSTSGVNRTNQFIIAEPITKDLNPEYGSIQKLNSRDTDLTVLCEDKIIKVLANKDALFEAGGNAQLTATNRVLGQSVPYVGEYGISKNPESFASYGFRSYFTDKARGVVLRLSRDGLTEISMHGMVDYFRDKLAAIDKAVGNFDDNKNLYNLTVFNVDRDGVIEDRGNNDTISFKEQITGWTSRKSFIPENALTLNNIYYSIYGGELYSHDNSVRNTFYGSGYRYNSDSTSNFEPSTITAVINDTAQLVKSFKTLNYEGTQAKIDANATDTDQLLYNITGKTGWYVSSITTDKQTGFVPEFIEKEGKWFNYIKGEETTKLNLDSKEFNIQGIGVVTTLGGDTTIPTVTITLKENAD